MTPCRCEKKLGAIIVLITACNCEYAHVRTRAPAFGVHSFSLVLLISTVCTVGDTHMYKSDGQTQIQINLNKLLGLRSIMCTRCVCIHYLVHLSSFFSVFSLATPPPSLYRRLAAPTE